MSVAVLLVTDGRDDYLSRTVRSAMANLSGPIDEWWMFDDTGDDVYRTELARRYPTFEHFNGGSRQGFGGAIRAAWAHLAEQSAAHYIAHIEADFVFNRPVPLADLAAVLDARPYLVQMALIRQAWNEEERAAGGLIARYPEAYRPAGDDQGRLWLEHRLFFSTNPSLYRRDLCHLGWPTGDRSEGMFTLRLLEEGMPGVPGDQVRFGYWGRPEDGPWVEHIGVERVGTGY